MRQRWLSWRALALHLALILWFPGCLIAFWWQVNRAFDGNGLSYLYSVEWPLFSLCGVWAWWQLLHTDPGTVGRRAQARMAAAGADVLDATAAASPPRRLEEEDAELRAYNDRLARLAQQGPSTWRQR